MWLSKKREQEVNQHRNRSEGIVSGKTPFAISEAYRTIRTNIIFSLPGETEEKCKVILFTSAVPREGKSTTCTNVAITFAMTGQRVVVVDADLRKPRLDECLGVKTGVGLSEYLVGMNELDEVIVPIEEHKIDFIPSGSIPPNPSELLGFASMKKLIKRLRERYDYVFIDMPPVTVVTDVSLVSKYADGVLLVAREKYTKHDMIQAAIGALDFAKAKVLGIIINDVHVSKIMGKHGGYYGRYGYGYGYGYSYSYGYGHRYGHRYGYGYGYGYGYEDSVKKKRRKDDKPLLVVATEEKKEDSEK